MKKKPPLVLFGLLAVLVIITLLALLLGTLKTPSVLLDPPRLWHRVVWPLIRLAGFISIGLFVGQLIEAMGWTNRLTVMARPFMRRGHLTQQMGAVFTTAFFSGTAALSMMKTFHQDGAMNPREVTLSVLLNTFPTFFLHLPTTFFIILPLVGWAGMIYLMLSFLAAVLRLFIALLLSSVMLPPGASAFLQKPKEKEAWTTIFKNTSGKFRSRLKRILLIVVPVYLVIAVVSDLGFFIWLRQIMAQGITTRFVPVEAMSVVIFSLAAEFTSGYAAAGAMMEAGALTVSQTVLALLVGNIVAAPVRALRHQMPYYMGIFNPTLGTRLILLSQGFRIASLAAVGTLYILIVMS